MSEPNNCTGHGLYLSGIFNVEEQLTEDQQFKVEFRSYSVLIGCDGANRTQQLHYEIRATGFSTDSMKLIPNNSYFLRGAFFPTNTEETYNDELFFEGADRLFVGTADNLPDSLVDKVGITGIGRVLDTSFVVEECMQYLKHKPTDPDKITLYAFVQHCDFHPETKLPRSVTVEYRVPPFKHLSGSPQIVKKGRECQFHGYIKDFNEETSRYVVIVNKVSPTSGHSDHAPRGKASKADKTPDPKGRPHIVKFNPRAVNTPFKSPVTGQNSTPTMLFGPTNETPTPGSSASQHSTSTVDLAPELTEPVKKRARAQPKRKAAPAIAPGSEEL